MCNKLFKNPKYLPCHHVYCEECLDSCWNKGSNPIACLECRKRAKVPVGGVKKFNNAFIINHLIDQLVINHIKMVRTIHLKLHVRILIVNVIEIN